MTLLDPRDRLSQPFLGILGVTESSDSIAGLTLSALLLLSLSSLNDSTDKERCEAKSYRSQLSEME